MIYVMLYRDRHGNLAGIRYDAKTHLYAASGAIMPKGFGDSAELPEEDQVLLAHEVSEVEKENLQPVIDASSDTPAMWLKTIGTFRAANINDPTKIEPHAYDLMEALVNTNRIPQFFEHLLGTMKAHKVLHENGERNEASGDRGFVTPFVATGTVDPRSLH